MAHLLWLIAFPWFFATDIIVLKNGKRIPCDRYTTDDQRTTLYRGEKVFSIPSNLIDWPRSEQATAAANAPEPSTSSQTESKPKSQSIPIVAKPPKKPIVLTNKDAKKWRNTSKNEPVVIQFKKIGNSIIVEASINQSKPYQFVLDTGASVTLVDPQVLSELNIPLGGGGGSVVGVSGQVIQAASGTLREISLNGATVNNLEVMARQIPQLAAINVMGLLGQDFLNHFIMELDAGRNILTLKPQNTAPQTTAKIRHDQIVNPNTEYRRMFGLINQLLRQYQIVRRGQGDQLDGIELNRIQRELGDINAKLRIYEQSVRELDPGLLPPKDKELRSRILRCSPLINKVSVDAQQFGRQLRRASKGNARDLDQLGQQSERLRAVVQDATDCR